MLPCQGKSPSKSQYKLKITRKTFGYFGKEQVFFARALAFAFLCLVGCEDFNLYILTQVMLVPGNASLLHEFLLLKHNFKDLKCMFCSEFNMILNV